MKRKILFFHHTTTLSGATRSLSFLLSELNKDKYEILVVLPKRKGNETVKELFEKAHAKVIEEIDIRPFNGSEVSPCKTIKQKMYSMWGYPKLVKCAERIVRSLNPDIVHLNSTCLAGAAKGTHIANDKTPVVCHVREPSLSNWWGRILSKICVRHVDWFISIDRYGLESLGNGASQRSSVIRNFVAPEYFANHDVSAQEKREYYGWTNDNIVFLFLSRIAPFNGIVELAETVERRKSELPKNVRFAIAGFKDLDTAYKKLAAKLVDECSICQRIEFDENPVALTAAADVIIAPFITPHSARSVFEGAAMSKPSVVTDLPNLVELIDKGKTGFAYNRFEEASFTSAVLKLTNTPLRKEMGLAARVFAENYFTQSTNVKAITKVYDKLLDC